MNHALHITLSSHSLLKMLWLAVSGFVFSMLITPFYTTLAYRWQLWKRPRMLTLTGQPATVFSQLHAEKHKRHIPTMAGVIFIVAVGILTLCFNLSRGQTWLPLAAFVGAAVVGLVDDIINIRSDGRGVAGLPSKLKLLLITLVALVGGWFFYSKLGVSSIHWPGIHGSLHIGWLIVPRVLFRSRSARAPLWDCRVLSDDRWHAAKLHLVQCVSGALFHGRCRFVRARYGTGGGSYADRYGAVTADHRCCLRGRSRLGYPPDNF
jgi:hypothetical protein